MANSKQPTVDAYRARMPQFRDLAARLEGAVQAVLKGTDHVDRVAFRVKALDSFAKKSSTLGADGHPKYAQPLSDIEDQVAGRVLVFFRRDIAPAAATLRKRFTRVEHSRKAPDEPSSFAYESEHLVFKIPPDVVPPGWKDLDEPPTTFELQVRTLWMHAWAEPQHDIEYKARVPLTPEEQRKIAWAASNAWGGDEIFEQVLRSLSARGGIPADAAAGAAENAKPEDE